MDPYGPIWTHMSHGSILWAHGPTPMAHGPGSMGPYGSIGAHMGPYGLWMLVPNVVLVPADVFVTICLLWLAIFLIC